MSFKLFLLSLDSNFQRGVRSVYSLLIIKAIIIKVRWQKCAVCINKRRMFGQVIILKSSSVEVMLVGGVGESGGGPQ